MPAHAIGHHQQTWTGVTGILIALAHQANIALGCVTQLKCHGSYF